MEDKTMKKQLLKHLITFLSTGIFCANIGFGSFIFSNPAIPPSNNTQECNWGGKGQCNHHECTLPGSGTDNNSGISLQNDEPPADVKTM